MRRCADAAILALLPSFAYAQIGGIIPPNAGGAAECTISSVFTGLNEIKLNPSCQQGCNSGSGDCPDDWTPGSIDECDTSCGQVFEPFWDSCGDLLTSIGMGGMDEMGIFYNKCLEQLYPPGSCGAFCNQHTWECFLADVNQACCDEGGANCPVGTTVPQTCTVGCALVFPCVHHPPGLFSCTVCVNM